MKQMEYLYQAVKKLKENIQCPICYEDLLDPITTKCNHHFCSTCYRKLFSCQGKQNCPVCSTFLTRRSCTVNSTSLKSIVWAVKCLTESLMEDTGVDFADGSVPVSSKEAFCNDSKRDSALNIHELDLNEQADVSVSSDFPGIPAAKGKERDDVQNIHRRCSKQYLGKRVIIQPDDSFVFPADYILPKKKKSEETKQPQEPVSNKVSLWLKKNENNLNDYEEMSILNGSLPKNNSPDFNISLSDDELMSVSQVNVNSKACLPPKKISVDIILDVENNKLPSSKIPDLRDPYEVESTQKSDTVKKVDKPMKHFARSYQNKKKSALLDVSLLVKEDVKKRKLNDTTIQAPNLFDDTFDQLMTSANKTPLKSRCEIDKNTLNLDNDKGKSDNEIFIFQSQNNFCSQSQKSLTDFSSGSDEEWGQTMREKLQNTRRKSERVFRNKISLPKNRRKSDCNIRNQNKKKKRKNHDDILENLHKAFQDIENHKLVTSSQVMREQIAHDEQEKRNVCNNNNSEKIINESPNNARVMNTECVSRSTGLPRVNKSEDESGRNDSLKNSCVKGVDKNVSNSSSVHLEHITKSLKPQEKFNSSKAKEDERKILSNISKNNPDESVHYLNLTQSEMRAKIMDDIFRVMSEQDLETVVDSPRNELSKEESVHFLNLTQSQERARVMSEVLKSYKSSLKTSEGFDNSGKSNIYVTLDNSIEELELNPENKVSDKPVDMDVFHGTYAETCTPFSVVICDDSEKLTGDFQDSNKQTYVPSEEIPKMCAEAAISNEKAYPLSVPKKQMPVVVGEVAKELDGNDKLSKMKQNLGDCRKETSAIIKKMSDREKTDENNCKEKVYAENEKMSVSSSKENMINVLNSAHVSDTFSRSNEISPKDPRELSQSILCEKANLESWSSLITLKDQKSNSLINKQIIGAEYKKNSKETNRKVRFFDEPVSSTKESGTITENCVAFMKLGKFSLSTYEKRVKFWLLGSCMSEAEKRTEVIRWIIKISKSTPICRCGNIKAAVMCKEQSSSFAWDSKDQIEVQQKRTVNNCPYICADGKDSNTPATKLVGVDGQVDLEEKEKRPVEKYLSDVSSCHNTEYVQKIVIDSHNNLSYIRNQDIDDDVTLSQSSDVLKQKKTTGKSSDEDIFQSGQKIEDEACKIQDQNTVDKNIDDKLFSSSSSEKLNDILPHNKIRELSNDSSPTDDLFPCLSDGGKTQPGYPDSLKNQSGTLLKVPGEINPNTHEKGVAREKWSVDKNREHVTIVFENKSNNGGKDFQLDISDNLQECPSLYEISKSPSVFISQDSLQAIESNPNTGVDIFASAQNYSQVKGSLLNEGETEKLNRKNVSPSTSSFSSDVNHLIEKPLETSCSGSDIPSANKRELQKSKINSSVCSNYPVNDVEDEDYLLNSDELLQRVMCNMNEDLGYTKAREPKLRGARKIILSDSEDDLTQDVSKSHENIRKSESCENMVKDILDNDMFRSRKEKYLIECSSKKNISDIDSEKFSCRNTNLSDEGQQEGSSPNPSSKLMLGRSSNYKKKFNSTPKIVLTQKSCNKRDDIMNKIESAGIEKSYLDVEQQVNVANLQQMRSTKQIISPQNFESENKINKTPVVKKDENTKKMLHFVCSGLPPTVVAKVKKFAQMCGAGFSENYCFEMTHLIVNVDENKCTSKTLKYLKAVAAKKWVISYDWIIACISARKLLPEEEYEAIDILGVDGPRQSRLGCVSPFKNIQVCLLEPFNSISHHELQDLFLTCGGQIVNSPREFSVSNNEVIRILVSDMDEDDVNCLTQNWLITYRAIAVISDWLLDSIGTYTLQPIDAYLLGSHTKDQLLACGIPENILNTEELESTIVSKLSD